MSYDDQGYQPQEFTMADRATAEERGQFIVRTYMHLFGAIMALVAIETVLQMTPFPVAMMNLIGSTGMIGMLVYMGLFIGASSIANRWAHGSASLSTQYMGLGLYVVVQAVILAPLLYLATRFHPGVLGNAAMATGFIFVGLTGVVFITRKNFSFMGPFLGVLGMAAIGIMFASVIFGFNPGILYTYGIIALAAGYILYSTSNVLHEYSTAQYVAASLSLFASVALLFRFILHLFMSRD